MADDKGGGGEDSGAEKTEEPTQRRIERARERGSVAKSSEVNSAFVLIFGLLILYFIGTGIIMNVGDAMKKIFIESGSTVINAVTVERIAIQMMIVLASTVLPISLMLMFIGISSNVAQVGFLFTTKPMEFQFSRMDPLKGIKRVFFSKRSLEEVFKGVMKVGIVAVVAYFSLKGVVNDSIMIIDSNVDVVMAFIGKAAVGVGIKMGLAFLALALFDYMFQWREHQSKLRMTKQELKDEMRESDGDPMTKSRIRMIQRTLARKRMLSDVPKADVIITNPTHIAIALKYEMGKMDAPRVIAKGAELIAKKIKAVAILHNIPIVEDPPLAQSLYKTVDIGETIPDQLFKAIAEILAYVYRLKNSRYGFGMN